MSVDTAKKRTPELLIDVTPARDVPANRQDGERLTLFARREMHRARYYLGRSWLWVSPIFSLAWCAAAATYMFPQQITGAGLLGPYSPATIHATTLAIATALAPLAMMGALCAAPSVKNGLAASVTEIVVSGITTIIGTTVAFIGGGLVYSVTGALTLAIIVALGLLAVGIYIKLVMVAEALWQGVATGQPETILAHSKFAQQQHSRIADTEI